MLALLYPAAAHANEASLIIPDLRSESFFGMNWQMLLSFGLIALAIPLKPGGGATKGRHGLATLFAVLTGVTIAAYIIADGMGVRSAGPDFEHRLAYIAWLCVLEGPWLLVFAVVMRPQTVWSHFRRNWWRGVIGGLIASTFAALFALPMIFAGVQKKTSTKSVSLDPSDRESVHYIPSLYESQQHKNDEHNEK